MGKVVKIVDHLRAKSPAHAAMMRVLDRQIMRQQMPTISECADEIFAGMWDEGFKIVPQEDTNAAG